MSFRKMLLFVNMIMKKYLCYSESKEVYVCYVLSAVSIGLDSITWSAQSHTTHQQRVQQCNATYGNCSLSTDSQNMARLTSLCYYHPGPERQECTDGQRPTHAIIRGRMMRLFFFKRTLSEHASLVYWGMTNVLTFQG